MHALHREPADIDARPYVPPATHTPHAPCCAQRHGRRGILLSAGWAPLAAAHATLPSATRRRLQLVCEPLAAHDLLLSRCAAALHHGGSGTVAAALAAGVPQVQGGSCLGGAGDPCGAPARLGRRTRPSGTCWCALAHGPCVRRLLDLAGTADLRRYNSLVQRACRYMNHWLGISTPCKRMPIAALPSCARPLVQATWTHVTWLRSCPTGGGAAPV